MFDEVEAKLQQAEYFLDRLKTLVAEAGGFARIEKLREREAALDGFFFEVIAAKDFFLQQMNKQHNLGLRSTEVNESRLRWLLTHYGLQNALEQVKKIEALLSDKNSWLWRLNNYRNVMAHRHGLQKAHKLELPSGQTTTHLFNDPDDPSQGHFDLEVVLYCEQSLKQMKGFLQELYAGLQA